MAAILFVKVLNSISFKNFNNSVESGSFTSNSSKEISISASTFKVTRSRLIRICSAKLINVSLRFGCFISEARSNRLSRSPYSLIRSAAVFTPIPGAPGTLSTESPARDCTSITRSGFTPNFSNTPSLSILLFFMASSISTPFPTSCIKSLSELIMVTRPPLSRACVARVAIMSSASKPACSIHDRLNALVASLVNGNCGTKSSGAGGLLAL